MSIHYPAGVKIPVSTIKEKKEKTPHKKYRLKIQAGNRGMRFEDGINQSNDYYLSKGVAVIHKKPTPINIVKVDYSHGAKIVEAFFQEPSTTDYNGIYKGKYIDFEAKSTHSKTAFPLKNIPHQQIEHLEAVLKLGAIAFFLIEIVPLTEIYLLPAEFVCRFYREKPRESIPVKEIKENGFLVKEKYLPRLDYLSVVDECFFK